MAHIFDYGEGDSVTIPGSVFLRRREGGSWEQRAAFDAQVSVGGMDR